MWKKPKKKKVLAPITQKLKELREKDDRLTTVNRKKKG